MRFRLLFRAHDVRLRWASRLQARGRGRKAFDICVRLADAGNIEAAYRVGRAYVEGSVVPLSRADAARWLEIAADRGHAAAQAMLAELHLHGLIQSSHAGTTTNHAAGVFDANATGEPDFVEALRWARRSAETGSAAGQALLGFILSHGPETMRDLAASRHWYELAALGGSAQGHFGWALAIISEIGREREAEFHLREAAAAGVSAGHYVLGRLAEKRTGTPPGPAAAADHYRHAAEAGHRAAQARLGTMLLDGEGVARDTLAGETLLRRAALGGDAAAAARIGQIYASANPLPPNYPEAAMWFERAATAGHRGAAHYLGMMYLSGSGVPPDPAEAARWFRVGAVLGDNGARADLARLVLDGEGDANDLAAMADWFRVEAEAGDVVAAFNYAICLAKGFGVARDDVRACQYLRRAARQLPSARYWYGMMLAEGRGVAENLAKARRHFASARGFRSCGSRDGIG